MRVLLAWYGRTGTTARVAGATRAALEARGLEVVEAQIQPRVDLPYLAWLLLSFLPIARWPIRGDLPDPASFDLCFLATPKWTFACPPVASFLARFGARLPPTALLLTYGGFDQVRYLRALEATARRRGVRVLDSLALRRRGVLAGDTDRDLHMFIERILRAAAA